MENRPATRRVWPIVLATVLLLLLAVLVARSCNQNYRAAAPVVTDTLDADGVDSSAAPAENDTLIMRDTTGGAGDAVEDPNMDVEAPATPRTPPKSALP